MLIIVALMLGGVLLGYCFRKMNLKFVVPLISVAIWVLLFLLGLQVGSDRNIMDNLDTIGWEAAVLTFGAVFGSLVCAWFVYRFFFLKQSKN